MHATWFLMQYTEDLRRHEPRNIGVLLETGGKWHSRFIARNDSGRIDGRRLKSLNVDRDTYSSWVSYYLRLAHENRLEDAFLFHKNKPSNFSLVPGGMEFERHADWDGFTQLLFDELVTPPKKGNLTVHERVKIILDRAMIPVQEEFSLDGKWGNENSLVKISFDWGVENNRVKIFEAIGGNQPNSIQALKAKMDAVGRVDKSVDFITLLPYSAYKSEKALDEALRPIEESSNAVNIDDEDTAIRSLRELTNI